MSTINMWSMTETKRRQSKNKIQKEQNNNNNHKKCKPNSFIHIPTATSILKNKKRKRTEKQEASKWDKEL